MRVYEFDPKTKTIPGLEITGTRGVLSLTGFSDAVIENLGAGMLYVDRYRSVPKCLKEIDWTAMTLYTAEDFIDSVERQVAGATISVADQRISIHKGMLSNHKKIYAGTNGSSDWHLVKPDSDVYGHASETLDTIDSEQVCSRSWIDLVLGTEDDKEIVEAPFFEHNATELATQARALRHLIPGEFVEIAHASKSGDSIIVANGLGAQPQQATNDQIGMLLKKIEIASWSDNKLQRRIERQAGKLTTLLHRIRTEPDKVYVEGMMNTYKDTISELVKNFVDITIAEQHNEYFTPTTKKQKRNKRMLDYASRQVEIDGPKINEELSDKIVAEPLPETTFAVEERYSKLELHGKHEFSFPWVPEPREYPVRVIHGDTKKVYVVTAQEPKVAAISSEVKKGLPKNEDGLDVFDQSILHRARTLAAGIMPYLDPSVKRIKNKSSEMREAYKNIAIWYPFDISPNAPRLYFTVRPAPKNLGEDIDNDDLLMIVIAEADKAHQIDVLKRFTTKSHRALVQQGAGSV